MVRPGRSWPPPVDGWPAVLFLHRAKGHGRQGPGKDDVVRGIPKDGSSRRDVGSDLTQQLHKGPSLRRELRLRSKETFYQALRQIIIMQETVNSCLNPAKLFIENRGDSELSTLGISHKMNQYVNLLNILRSLFSPARI
jgi:hypothetical protein